MDGRTGTGCSHVVLSAAIRIQRRGRHNDQVLHTRGIQRVLGQHCQLVESSIGTLISRGQRAPTVMCPAGRLNYLCLQSAHVVSPTIRGTLILNNTVLQNNYSERHKCRQARCPIVPKPGCEESFLNSD